MMRFTDDPTAHNKMFMVDKRPDEVKTFEETVSMNFDFNQFTYFLTCRQGDRPELEKRLATITLDGSDFVDPPLFIC